MVTEGRVSQSHGNRIRSAGDGFISGDCTLGMPGSSPGPPYVFYPLVSLLPPGAAHCVLQIVISGQTVCAVTLNYLKYREEKASSALRPR